MVRKYKKYTIKDLKNWAEAKGGKCLSEECKDKGIELLSISDTEWNSNLIETQQKIKEFLNVFGLEA